MFPRSRPLERVDGDARVLTFLERVRFPAERLISALDGSGSCDLDGHGLIVTALIPGKPPGSTSLELQSLGSLVGRLVSLDQLPPEVRRRAGSLPREDLDYGSRCLAEVKGLLEDAWRPRWEALDRALAATGDGADLPQTLIHPDCHPGNAIRRPDGQIELIDWAGAGIGPRIAALGVLLSGAVLTGLDRTGDGCDLARVDAVAEGFRRHVHLEPEEIARMVDAIRFRPLVLAAREFASGVRRGSAPGDGGAYRYDLAGVVADRVEAILR